MKDLLLRQGNSLQRQLSVLSAAQKASAAVGVVALLVAAVMLFNWATKPTYTPLFTGLSNSDAAAVIQELDARGLPYELVDGGATIRVPQADVYATRIALSAEGLPAGDEGGYALLDEQGIATSQFQEQTAFKRAMETELGNTIASIDGVSSAVVHLALPVKQVFAEEQAPPTASVLLTSGGGDTLDAQQTQAVVHLVASSIDGMDPDDVTVADSSGQVLSAGDGNDAAAASTRTQQTMTVQNEMRSRIQTMLDRVVGPGNSTVQVTADLDFDNTVRESTFYNADPNRAPLSESTTTERYDGPGAAAAGGVLGPDGQTEIGNAGDDETTYRNTSTTRDNAVDKTVERREEAQGQLEALHVGVVLDARNAGTVDPNEISRLISSTVGIDRQRGDTVQVASLPFDRTAEEATAAEIAAADEAAAAAARMDLYRNLGLGLVVLLVLLLAWRRARRSAADREAARQYVVEQLRADQDARRAPAELEDIDSPALAALEAAQEREAQNLKEQLEQLVDSQPDDVAALLRGWLVEPRQ
ncbi:flagellar M-ring protein FliF [Nocardioidaceae bacterium]|nr:flagellar M-ring protein FliF [Nocardioidaceae bacterium]